MCTQVRQKKALDEVRPIRCEDQVHSTRYAQQVCPTKCVQLSALKSTIRYSILLATLPIMYTACLRMRLSTITFFPSLTKFSSKLFLGHPTNASCQSLRLTNISTREFDMFMVLLNMQGHPKVTLLDINLPMCPSMPFND